MNAVKFLKQTEMTDLLLVCSDGLVETHKIVISSFAPFVKNLLIESHSSEIILPDFKMLDLQEIMDICYGIKEETENEGTMKVIFNVLGVNSQDILVNNVTIDFEKTKTKMKRGFKKLKFSSNRKPPKICEMYSTNDGTNVGANDETPSSFHTDNPGEISAGLIDHDYLGRRTIAEPTFSCGICSKVFKSSVGLVKHKKKMHQEVKVDIIVGTKVCLVCQVSLKRTELLKHMKDKHPDREIGFSCYICDKNFPCLAKLKRHIVIHEPRTENFICDQCDFVTVMLSAIFVISEPNM